MVYDGTSYIFHTELTIMSLCFLYGRGRFQFIPESKTIIQESNQPSQSLCLQCFMTHHWIWFHSFETIPIALTFSPIDHILHTPQYRYQEAGICIPWALAWEFMKFWCLKSCCSFIIFIALFLKHQRRHQRKRLFPGSQSISTDSDNLFYLRLYQIWIELGYENVVWCYAFLAKSSLFDACV